MLDAHPNIACPTWETGLFDRMNAFVTGDFERPRVEDNFCTLPRAEVVAWMHRCADDLMGHLVARTGKRRWGEKTPAHVFHISLIDEVYPGSQFVHIIRDGRDVVRSLLNTPWAPGGVHWCACRWRDSVTAGREAGDRLGPARYLELRYEELTSTPRPVLERLCAFLGEPLAESMLEFHKPENNSWGLATRGIQKRPINQYRQLRLHEKLRLQWDAGGLLKQLGYR